MSSWLGFGGSKQEKQAEEAKAWKAGHLGTGDEGFKHLREARDDNGVFAVSEVRGRPKQADRGGSRLVRLPKGNYDKPPHVAKGLMSCDLNHQGRDHDGKQALDLELEVFADDTKYMSPLIQAWYSDENTQLIYDAKMTWMETKQDADDCYILITSFDLTKKEHAKPLKFPKPFDKGTEPDVVRWLKGFRFSSEGDKPYSFDIWPTNVSNKGLTANVKGSENAERVDLTIIAYRKDKNKVASGSFSTEDAEDRKQNAPEASGKVKFPKGKFHKAPTVLTALSQFDLAGGRDLRIGAEVKEVTKDGFYWTLRTWGQKSDDALRSAEAAYVALGFN